MHVIKSIALYLPASFLHHKVGLWPLTCAEGWAHGQTRIPGQRAASQSSTGCREFGSPPGRDHAMLITTHCQASASHLSLCQVLHCIPQLQALNSHTQSTYDIRAVQALQRGHYCSRQQPLLRDLLISCPRNGDLSLYFFHLLTHQNILPA